ncbi:MAG: hypothetical protein SFT81_02170 [Candidatus Caenarcaniphilales bacterium]|nr:hypothetical protein [Candidatus Caenarcaniphilales bacterium]
MLLQTSSLDFRAPISPPAHLNQLKDWSQNLKKDPPSQKGRCEGLHFRLELSALLSKKASSENFISFLTRELYGSQSILFQGKSHPSIDGRISSIFHEIGHFTAQLLVPDAANNLLLDCGIKPTSIAGQLDSINQELIALVFQSDGVEHLFRHYGLTNYTPPVQLKYLQSRASDIYKNSLFLQAGHSQSRAAEILNNPGIYDTFKENFNQALQTAISLSKRRLADPAAILFLDQHQKRRMAMIAHKLGDFIDPTSQKLLAELLSESLNLSPTETSSFLNSLRSDDHGAALFGTLIEEYLSFFEDDHQFFQEIFEHTLRDLKEKQLPSLQKSRQVYQDMMSQLLTHFRESPAETRTYNILDPFSIP